MAEKLSQELGLEVYTFSVFHIFFEQYLGIGATSVRILGSPPLMPLLPCFTCIWIVPSPGSARCSMLSRSGNRRDPHETSEQRCCHNLESDCESRTQASTHSCAGGALVAVLATGWLLMGSLWGAGLMAGVIAALLVQLAGALPLLGVQLNAVSLVNLTMAAGIAVEFCAHIVHAFLGAPGARPHRAAAALVAVGASVLSGITLTKLVGARSPPFR